MEVNNIDVELSADIESEDNNEINNSEIDYKKEFELLNQKIKILEEKDKQKTQQLVNQRNIINDLKKQEKTINNNNNVINYEDYLNEVEHYKQKLIKQEQELLSYQQQLTQQQLAQQLKSFVDVGKEYNISSEEEFIQTVNKIKETYGVDISNNPTEQNLNLFRTYLVQNKQIDNAPPLKSSNQEFFVSSKAINKTFEDTIKKINENFK